MSRRPDALQPSLFDRTASAPPAPRPRQGVAATSRDAARRHAPRASEQRTHLRAALLAAGSAGLTRQELADLTGIKLQSVCSGIDALRRAALVCEPLAPGSAGHLRRDGRNVVVAIEHTHTLATLDRQAVSA